MPELLDTCARELMDTAPQIMRSIRVEMRRGRGSDLSIPQFRTLGFIQRNADSTLSSLADHLGLTLPSVSKLVDGLVKQELVIRQESSSDRRCLALVLTPVGESIVNSARASAQASLATTLGKLSADELDTIRQAMELLRPLFAPQGTQGMQGKQTMLKE
jgi:MarR family transcriptional regulator for hemolysin